MSLRADLLGAVTGGVTEVSEIQIALSGIVDRMDGLIQLHATDLAETNNPDADQFVKQLNAARGHLEGLIGALDEAEQAGHRYAAYLA